MNLTSPSQVKAWCIENDFHPNKTLGQNFLIDQNVLKAIVDAGLEKVKSDNEEGKSADGGVSVLEIGPGLGVLTEEMLKRGCTVTAIEKDPVLAERLEKCKIENAECKIGTGDAAWSKLTVIAGDALEVLARPSTFDLQPSTFSCMISNLPYQAGTRILLDFCERRELKVMTALVQTEVAERLAAGPGSKTRGLAGALAQLDYDVVIVRKVSAACFWPRPEIGSSVIRLERHDRNAALSAAERRAFKILVKRGFEQRRKQLGSIFRDLIQSSARAEELSNEDWVMLAKALSDKL